MCRWLEMGAVKKTIKWGTGSPDTGGAEFSGRTTGSCSVMSHVDGNLSVLKLIDYGSGPSWDGWRAACWIADLRLSGTCITAVNESSRRKAAESLSVVTGDLDWERMGDPVRSWLTLTFPAVPSPPQRSAGDGWAPPPSHTHTARCSGPLGTSP